MNIAIKNIATTTPITADMTIPFVLHFFTLLFTPLPPHIRIIMAAANAD
jgi:hypothetical protein